MSTQILVDGILTRTKRGPYNKISKMQRRQRVKELYFDKEYFIIDIANTLGINRNTVSSDVEYWRKEYTKFGGENEIFDFYYQKKSMFAIQRKRLEEKIKTDPTNQHRFEKLLMDLTEKEFKLISKFRPVSKNIDTDPKLVKKIIRELAFDEFSFSGDGELIKEIISKTKCDVPTAKSIVDEMRNLGLDYTKDPGIDYSSLLGVKKNSMTELATICGYLSSKEISNILKEQDRRAEQIEREYQNELSKYNEEFAKKYGDDSKNWSKEVRREYNLGLPGYG